MKMEMVDNWLEMAELVINFNIVYCFLNVWHIFLEHYSIVIITYES